MQIVIDIDEDLYTKIYSDAEIMIYGGMRSGKTLLATLLRAIRNGTPLPKGHGKLIDADYLREDFKASKKISFAERMDISCIVDHAPTIIEADKESEDVESQESESKRYMELAKSYSQGLRAGLAESEEV